MTGIGIIQTASTFQESGWLLTTICFLVYMIISSLCALFIVEAMQAIPGNRYFTGTVEFGTLINFYFGPTAHIFGQFALYGALQSIAIGSLVQSSQTMDNVFIDMFGKTCGISLSVNNVTNNAFEWYCVSNHGVTLSPFGNEYMLFTAGYLGAFLIIFPMCIYPLEDIVWIQTLSFVVTLIVFVEWIVVSGVNGLHADYVPTLGQSSGYAGLVGVVMLNYAFVQTIPAWVNVRRPDVSITRSVWISSGCGFTTYLLTGLIPAMAYQIPSTSNLIQVMQSSGGVVTKVFGILFSMIVLMMSVPVFFVVCKSNLEQNFKMNKFVSVGLSYVVPWALAIPFATGTYLTSINVWGSLIFVSMANFIIPLVIYFKAVLFRKSYNERRYLTKKQRDLLKVIHGNGYGNSSRRRDSAAPNSRRAGSPFSLRGRAHSPLQGPSEIPILLLHEPDGSSVEMEHPSPTFFPPSLRLSPDPSPRISLNDDGPIENLSDSTTTAIDITTLALNKRATLSAACAIPLPSELLDMDMQQESYLLEDVPDPDAELEGGDVPFDELAITRQNTWASGENREETAIKRLKRVFTSPSRPEIHVSAEKDAPNLAEDADFIPMLPSSILHVPTNSSPHLSPVLPFDETLQGGNLDMPSVNSPNTSPHLHPHDTHRKIPNVQFADNLAGGEMEVKLDDRLQAPDLLLEADLSAEEFASPEGSPRFGRQTSTMSDLGEVNEKGLLRVPKRYMTITARVKFILDGNVVAF
ncbi:hypothetical protein HDU98_011739 [Podochytrium sp. JEL0797]|nr:hypothetical protein HDU98_011739 [Podochytrium sp. JEL0797]